MTGHESTMPSPRDRCRWFLQLASILLICCAAPWTAAASSLWPDLSEPASRRGGGEGDAAVVVGIEDYVDLPPIPGAADNARDWYLWFTESRRTPVERVHLLRDREATREGILDELEQAADQVDGHGMLWFVFIGHGAPSSDGRDGILLGWDTQQTSRSVFARGLAQADVLDVLDRHAQSVAILDACFSGRAGSGDTLVDGLQPVVPEYAVDAESTTVLTAAENDQYAGPLPGGNRPAFSYLVLGALRGWGDSDGNGRVTGGEVVAYTSKAMVTVVQDRAQSPVGFGPGRNRTLARGKERGPDLARVVLEAERQTDSRSSRGGGGAAKTDATPVLHQPSPTGSSMDEMSKLVAVEWKSLWAASSSSAERKELLTAFVDKYDAVEVSIGSRTVAIELPEVRQARILIQRSRNKATVGFLGGFSLGMGGSNELDFGQLIGDMSFVVATRGRSKTPQSVHHLFHGGVGFGGIGGQDFFTVRALGGASQLISNTSPAGHRPSLLLTEGVMVFFGYDRGPVPALDLRVQYANWHCNDYFFSIGGQFLVGVMNVGDNMGGTTPHSLLSFGIIFQSGGLQFLL